MERNKQQISQTVDHERRQESHGNHQCQGPNLFEQIISYSSTGRHGRLINLNLATVVELPTLQLTRYQ